MLYWKVFVALNVYRITIFGLTRFEAQAAHSLIKVKTM